MDLGYVFAHFVRHTQNNQFVPPVTNFWPGALMGSARRGALSWSLGWGHDYGLPAVWPAAELWELVLRGAHSGHQESTFGHQQKDVRKVKDGRNEFKNNSGSGVLLYIGQEFLLSMSKIWICISKSFSSKSANSCSTVYSPPKERHLRCQLWDLSRSDWQRSGRRSDHLLWWGTKMVEGFPAQNPEASNCTKMIQLVIATTEWTI